MKRNASRRATPTPGTAFAMSVRSHDSRRRLLKGCIKRQLQTSDSRQVVGSAWPMYPRGHLSFVARGAPPPRARSGARRLAILARAAGAFVTNLWQPGQTFVPSNIRFDEV